MHEMFLVAHCLLVYIACHFTLSSSYFEAGHLVHSIHDTKIVLMQCMYTLERQYIDGHQARLKLISSTIIIVVLQESDMLSRSNQVKHITLSSIHFSSNPYPTKLIHGTNSKLNTQTEGGQSGGNH
jgi:hypothetical protein